MEIIYRLGQATVAEVLARLPDPPSYSAVRATMGQLKKKGHLKYKESGARHVYFPTVAREKAQKSMLDRLIKTFFNGSIEKAVASLLSSPSTKLSAEEWERLSDLIEQAKKEGR